jgi:ParB/RepB/Spo0J family partition protein
MPQVKPLPVDVPIKDVGPGENVRETNTQTPAFGELEESVRTHGILEPLLVRPAGADGKARGAPAYDLVAGYRRYEAAKRVGLKSVPVRVLELSDAEVAEVQLIENLLRQDLSPMEEARAIHALSETRKLKPKEVAAKLSKSETWVRGRLALLNLSPKLQAAMEKGELDAAHAVLLATLPVEAQEEFFENGEPMTGPVDDWMRREIKAAAERYAGQKAVRDQAAKSKFPVCPKCGAPPDSPAFGQRSTSVVQDDEQHVWNLNTGEVRSKRSVIDADPTIAEERKQRQEERYDRSVCPAVNLGERLWKIVGGLVEEAADDLVEVHVRDGELGGLTLELHFSEGPLYRKIPAYFGAKLYPIDVNDPKAGGLATQAVVTPASGKDRTAALKVVRDLAKLLPEATPLDPAPSELDQPLAKVLGWIGGYEETESGGRSYGPRKKGQKDPREDRIWLQRLRLTEAAGKNRGGVLDAIDNLLGADTPTTHSEY